MGKVSSLLLTKLVPTKTWLLYGANGYTGELIAREAARRGWTPILAGRKARAIEALGRELGLPTRLFKLDDPDRLTATLTDVEAVLNCAGPFIHTAAPMVEACLQTGTHYLDITGEIGVFEAIAKRDAQAQAAGILLLPGVGFDVVPTDCLAARLAQALPGAVELQLAFHSRGGGLSRGTLKTAIENLPRRGAIRQAGKIEPVPALYDVQEFEFGVGRRWAMSVPWGDVSTAYYTTGIPTIRTYIAAPRGMIVLLKWLAPLMPLTGWAPFKRLARWAVDRAVTGPGNRVRETARVYLFGRVRNVAGEEISATLETPEGYWLTALAALASVERVLSGEIPPGFWTPARAFGVDFVTGLPGVGRFEMSN